MTKLTTARRKVLSYLTNQTTDSSPIWQTQVLDKLNCAYWTVGEERQCKPYSIKTIYNTEEVIYCSLMQINQMKRSTFASTMHWKSEATEIQGCQSFRTQVISYLLWSFRTYF